jgi:Kef-type K+ transport system membrane component KefB
MTSHSDWRSRALALRRIVLRHGPLLLSLVVALGALVSAWTPGILLDYFRHRSSPFENFTLVLLLVLLLPRVLEGLRLPGLVGLLLGGVLIGPYGLELAQPDGKIVDLFAGMGRVFLMFIAGLEIDMAVFRATRSRSLGFGALTFALPLLAGIGVAWWFEFPWVSAVLVGSLIASHTLLGLPGLSKLGLGKAEPVAVTVGATMLTDIAALLVLAMCVSVFKGGFSPWELIVQLVELAVYAIIVLQGLPLVGHWYFRRHRDDEQTQFLFTFLVVMLAAAGAHFIHLEDIVGGFLAGLAVNRLLTEQPVREKLILMGAGLFVPLFFVSIGVKLNLPVFVATLGNSLGFVAAIFAALSIGKAAAAAVAGRAFGYDRAAWLAMWSLSLPQVAATLAAAMTAYETIDADGDRLITESVLNAIIVLMVITSVLGPVLTDIFGRRMAGDPGTEGETLGEIP